MRWYTTSSCSCRGVSSEARKRVSIATEIVTKPPILFLDEPTSGLTADGALSVMTVVRNVASAGHAVVSTIHQPSTQVFEMFDEILLLQKGGHTVYFGELGAASHKMVKYLESAGAPPCQTHEVRACRARAAVTHVQNPADFMLRETAVSSTVGASEKPSINWAEHWLRLPCRLGLRR